MGALPVVVVPGKRILPRVRLGAVLVGVACLAAGAAASSAANPPPMSASMILQELRAFRGVGSVLYVAAHPDDENTRLIAYLTRGRGYRTGYLSLTRGDGGQNLLGTELGPELGMIRTQELLAARRTDGGEQFFSRAIDFGYSKTARETLSIWNREEVLEDIVRVIRNFKPDVIVTRFNPVPGGTHGHHTASAMLVVEAFDLAADPNAFVDTLGNLPPWRAKRVVWNSYSFRSRETQPGESELDVGGFNALLGESYGEIAARARSMHKSQGFGAVARRGSTIERFKPLAGEPFSADIMDGVDTSWARVPGGEQVQARIDEIVAHFDPFEPSASVPKLLELRASLGGLEGNGTLDYKRRQLDRIIAGALGLYTETTVPAAEYSPGESVTFEHQVIVRSDVPVEWVAVRYPDAAVEIPVGRQLAFNREESVENTYTLPADTPLSQPYWLREPAREGMYTVSDPQLRGMPENPPVLRVENVFSVGGQRFVVAGEPEQITRDPVRGEVRRRLEVVPPVTVAFADRLALLAPGERRAIDVEVVPARGGASGIVSIEAPAGWEITPERQSFSDAAAGVLQRFTFHITAPAQSATARLVAAVETDGRTWRHARREIAYDHIPFLLNQPVASLQAVSLDVKVTRKRIGYLPGAGDLVPESLARLGCTVTTLSEEDLTPDGLKGLDAVVLGVRAFNTREGLPARFPNLLAFVEAGGNLIVQYNTTSGLKSETLGPYPLRLSRDRVTDETAEITILAPDHPVLNRPNRITADDFSGWVQERGLYFPSTWDERYTAVLSAHDEGESPKNGSLLVTRYGKGYFVYTGISFFRQLPAGVPGAYRLFANLLSLED